MKKLTTKSSRDGLLKEGTSRLARTTNRRAMPRVMWLAIFVCVAGAVLLFRNQGGDVPTGIGERRSVVTVGGDSAATPATAPRSGDVDLGSETRNLTAEQPAQADAAPTKPATTTTKPATTTTATTKPTTTAAPPAAAVAPADDGPWLVQVGSFGEAANADRAAAGLRAKGWDARVKVGNTSDGSMIHRVQIGYFASRQLAETFIAQNRKDLAGAIAVHR